MRRLKRTTSWKRLIPDTRHKAARLPSKRSMNMWPFSKKRTLGDIGVFQGLTDCHSHILPGVDDGVRTMEESLEILDRYERLGVKAVWLTPHIMEDVPNKTGDLKARFEELRKNYQGGLELHLGAENMIDGLFEERLNAGDLLTMGENHDRLLVETSYFTPPYGLYEILETVKSKGMFPILAHPERYIYMSDSDYSRLKSMGVLFQLNLFSLAGLYGPRAAKVAADLLKKGFYDHAGTDIHAIKVLDRCLEAPIEPKILEGFKAL